MKRINDRDDPIWKTYAEQDKKPDTDKKHGKDEDEDKDLEHN